MATEVKERSVPKPVFTDAEAGAKEFPSWQSRSYNYFTPRKRRATVYEDVTVDVQPDPARHLSQGWVYEFANGIGGYPQEWTALKSSNWHEFLDPNVVKVVTGRGSEALYFSRAPIPWHRDGATHGLTSQTSILGAQRHLGIYAYRVDSLRRLTAMTPSDLEVTEKLEQLRALQAGMRLVVGIASVVPPAGVDTESDLARVRSLIGSGATG